MEKLWKFCLTWDDLGSREEPQIPGSVLCRAVNASEPGKTAKLRRIEHCSVSDDKSEFAEGADVFEWVALDQNQRAVFMQPDDRPPPRQALEYEAAGAAGVNGPGGPSLLLPLTNPERQKAHGKRRDLGLQG